MWCSMAPWLRKVIVLIPGVSSPPEIAKASSLPSTVTSFGSSSPEHAAPSARSASSRPAAKTRGLRGMAAPQWG